MMTVMIYINETPIYVRSCRRIITATSPEEPNEYRVDDGRTIKHRGKDGAVMLAMQLLEGIEEL